MAQVFHLDVLYFKGVGECIEYSDSAMGWTVWGSNRGRGKRFSCFPTFPCICICVCVCVCVCIDEILTCYT
jgi:hypothetical protein